LDDLGVWETAKGQVNHEHDKLTHICIREQNIEYQIIFLTDVRVK